MAERMPTTQKAEAEGLTVALTKENYPLCLRAYDAGIMTEGCADLARFIREAVLGVLMLHEQEGTPPTERDYRGVWNGFELVCDLLVDRLEIAAGEGYSPMPLLKDLEARHG